jgi:hypothetical protein
VSVTKLRLGPLPKATLVKLTVTVPLDLRVALERYADMHSQLHGEKVDATALVPYMLSAFIERDRGFKSLTSKNTKQTRAVPLGGKGALHVEGDR